MQLRSVGFAAVAGAMLVLTACGSAVATSGASTGGTPSTAPEVETSAPAVPDPPKPERTGTATPIETAAPPSDPEVRPALAAANVMESALDLVEAEELEEAQALLQSGSPLDWEPRTTGSWTDEYDRVRDTRWWYLQLWDGDGPAASEVTEWSTNAEDALAELYAAVEAA